MKTLRGQEALSLLGVNDSILDELKRMHGERATPEQMIDYLQAQQVTKPGATLALRLSKVMPVSETKPAVHFSRAYAYRREADEVFVDSALTAFEQTNGLQGTTERSEAAA